MSKIQRKSKELCLLLNSYFFQWDQFRSKICLPEIMKNSFFKLNLFIEPEGVINHGIMIFLANSILVNFLKIIFAVYVLAIR